MTDRVPAGWNPATPAVKRSRVRAGTHDFALHDMMAAYDTFAEAGKHNALKVVIRR